MNRSQKERVKSVIEGELLADQTGPVNLLRREDSIPGFDEYDTTSGHPDPQGWTYDQCVKWWIESEIIEPLNNDPQHMPILSCELLITQLRGLSEPLPDVEIRKRAIQYLIDNPDHCLMNDLRDEIRDLQSKSRGDIYQWWLITAELAVDLRELNQVVIDNDFGQWWGRTERTPDILKDRIWSEWLLLQETIESRAHRKPIP